MPCACCASVGTPPLGSSFRHVSSAAGYCGDRETVPPTEIVPLELGSGSVLIRVIRQRPVPGYGSLQTWSELCGKRGG
jgi:hypothetical protein